MIRSVQIYPLSTRVDADGGPVRSSVQDEPGESRNSLRQSGCRNILILVHGFNNRQRKAEQSYDLFYGRLEELFRESATAPEAVAYFHWPGNHYQFTAFDAFAWYHIDILRARDSAVRLAEYLTGFPDPASLRVTLVGHSLGCRLILEMLLSLAGRPRIPTVNLVSLMAPAVPVALCVNAGAVAAGQLNPTVGPPRRVLKFFSWRDLALSGGFPAGQLMAATCGIEAKPYAEAVGLLGNPTEVGEAFPTTNGHGDYWGDVRTTDVLRSALDPRYFKLPPPYRVEGREIGPAPPIDDRELPSRR
jgi:pimeloyl-ACP methyl ester carboxylesterase